jgi:hypothetical protein
MLLWKSGSSTSSQQKHTKHISCHFSPFHILITYFSKTHFNIILTQIPQFLSFISHVYLSILMQNSLNFKWFTRVRNKPSFWGEESFQSQAPIRVSTWGPQMPLHLIDTISASFKYFNHKPPHTISQTCANIKYFTLRPAKCRSEMKPLT